MLADIIGTFKLIVEESVTDVFTSLLESTGLYFGTSKTSSNDNT